MTIMAYGRTTRESDAAEAKRLRSLRERAIFPVPVELRPARPIWQLLAWTLIAGGLWDGGGLVFAPASYFSSKSYEAVRAFGGIRPLGVVLLVITVAFIWNLATSNTRNLRWVLTAGFIYNLFWLLALFISWANVGVSAWPGPTKAASLAIVYLILAVKVDERRG